MQIAVQNSVAITFGAAMVSLLLTTSSMAQAAPALPLTSVTCSSPTGQAGYTKTPIQDPPSSEEQEKASNVEWLESGFPKSTPSFLFGGKMGRQVVIDFKSAVVPGSWSRDDVQKILNEKPTVGTVIERFGATVTILEQRPEATWTYLLDSNSGKMAVSLVSTWGDEVRGKLLFADCTWAVVAAE